MVETSTTASAGSPTANQLAAAPHEAAAQRLPEDIDQHVAADDDDNDSAYAVSLASDGTSVTSSIYRGYLENGRKYQTLKDDGYFTPADERQFDVLKAGHMVFRVLDSQEDNPLFRSPLSDNAQNILDIGTGDGSWPIDVADNFPHIEVHGVDLFPPAETSVPPNVVLEVDDITKPWMFEQKFDLIHLRLFAGSCDDREWKRLYKEAYDNLVPGGFIEQMECSVELYCDDNTMPSDSYLSKVGEVFHQCGDGMGKSFDTIDTMRSRIEAAGFINIKEKNYKMPMGPWAKHPVYKDAGRICLEVWRSGMEGWMIYLLCRYGQPAPWSPEECQVWFAKIRSELDSNWHIYQKGRRIWAQKPYDSKPSEEEKKVKVENLA